MPRLTRLGGPSIYGVTPVKGAHTAVESVRVSTVDLIGEAHTEAPEELGEAAPEAEDSAAQTDSGETDEITEKESAETAKPRKAAKAGARRSIGGR